MAYFEMNTMARPRKHDLPKHMTVDGRGGFFVRNPVSGKMKRFSDEGEARRAALAVAELLDAEKNARLLEAGRPTVAGLVDKWLEDRLQFMPWKASTKTNILAKIQRIKRELGHRLLGRTDSVFLEDWLTSFCHTADTFNKWRETLVHLWAFAVARKLGVEVNEAENVLKRSVSLNIDANHKVRHPLDVKGFLAIRDHAPNWLQLAMDIAMVTLQGRSEVCNMKHTDFRDGYLFVIREKTSTKSDAAFIRIKVTEDFKELRSRAMRLDNVASPFLIHRKPERRVREVVDSKAHWTYVRPDYLTKAFAEARDQSRVYANLRDEEMPTFHEIRGLGSRICEARGMGKTAIKVLMAHADEKTTDIYLKGGAGALRDTDFVAVEAPMVLSEMLA